MFDVGFSELVLIFIIGLLVLGPERLPKVASQIGRWVGRARRTATQLRHQLEREIALSELAESQKKKSQAEKPPAGKPETGAAAPGADASGADASGADASGAAGTSQPEGDTAEPQRASAGERHDADDEPPPAA
jgi:sec-independent protein translocase protein TatB